MSSVRRGSSSKDLQIKTVFGTQETGDLAIGSLPTLVADLKDWEVSPPPGMHWEIHQIHVHQEALIQYALDGDSGPDPSHSVPILSTLTFGDETPLNEGNEIADQGSGPNDGGTKSDGAEEDSDEVVIGRYGKMEPGDESADSNGVYSFNQKSFVWDETVDFQQPLIMSDLEELSMLWTTRVKQNARYQADPSVASVSSCRIMYEPREA